MKVTLLQTDISWANPDENICQVQQLLAQSEESDLYVLPEMWSTGFATEPEGIASDEVGNAALEWMKSEAAIYTVAEDGMKTYQPVEEIDSKWTTVKSFDVAIPVGISYEYENVVLDARYHFGLTTVFKSGLWSSTNSVFSITVGYKFDL